MYSKNAKKPTKAESARMARLKEMPCVCCYLMQVTQPFPTEVHHIVQGNRRVGHGQTLPLCGWSHRGLLLPDHSVERMTMIYGPSLANGSKPFHGHFGSEGFLLQLTNERLT